MFFTGELFSKSFLVGSFSRCSDMIGSVRSSLNDILAVAESAIIVFRDVSLDGKDGIDKVYFHDNE